MKLHNNNAAPEILVGERKMSFSTFILKYNPLIIFALLFIISTFLSPFFLTQRNLVNILRQQSTYIIIAMGLLMPLVSGGIDLSIASVVGLGSILITELVTMNNMGIIEAILIAILLSALIGAINGSLIAFLNMPPFIVTLAMSYGVMGLVFIFSGGANRMLRSDDPLVHAFINFGQNNDPLFGLPWRVYLTIAIVLIFVFIMKFTTFGRLMTATGSNPTAVNLAGISTKKYRFLAPVISSTLAGFAGIMLTAGQGASSPTTVAGDFTMIAIAGAIIGGADLGGGKGTAHFTVVGIFIMGIIQNIMNLSNVPAYPQWVVKAVVIIIAIFLRSFINTRNSK